MKRTPAEAEATRLRLLEAAAGIFGKIGFAAARLEDIARAAGVTRGAIYWHFKDKHDLFRSLMQLRMARISEQLAAIYLSDLPPVTKLRQLLLESLLNLETDADYRSGIQLALSIGLEEERLTELRKRRREHIRMMIEHLEQLLQECAQTGVLRPEVTVRQAAIGLIAWYDGIAGFWLRTSPRPLFKLADDAPALVELVLRSILLPESD